MNHELTLAVLLDMSIFIFLLSVSFRLSVSFELVPVIEEIDDRWPTFYVSDIPADTSQQISDRSLSHWA
jgi:hypothetical protein